MSRTGKFHPYSRPMADLNQGRCRIARPDPNFFCGETLPNETYWIESNGGLKNVVVFVESA
ncbi:MAG: hypothetical protein ACXW5W_13120, partial [Candidatus Binatia bacterium]